MVQIKFVSFLLMPHIHVNTGRVKQTSTAQSPTITDVASWYLKVLNIDVYLKPLPKLEGYVCLLALDLFKYKKMRQQLHENTHLNYVKKNSCSRGTKQVMYA